MIRFKGKTIKRKRQKVLDILMDRKREKKRKFVTEKERHRDRERRETEREKQKERLSKTNEQLEKYLP